MEEDKIATVDYKQKVKEALAGSTVKEAVDASIETLDTIITGAVMVGDFASAETLAQSIIEKYLKSKNTIASLKFKAKVTGTVQ